MSFRTRRQTRLAPAAVALGACLLLVASCSSHATTTDARGLRQVLVDRGTRLNQLQTVGTHNSYHIEAPAAEETLRQQADPADEATFDAVRVLPPTPLPTGTTTYVAPPTTAAPAAGN